MKTKTVIMLELTSPWEENFGKRHKQKMRKYNLLVLDLEEGKHNGVKWNAQLLCVEIGARGALHEMAWGRMCGTFGIKKGTRKALINAARNKMMPSSAAISSVSAATTKSGNLKHYEIIGCPLKGQLSFIKDGFR